MAWSGGIYMDPLCDPQSLKPYIIDTDRGSTLTLFLPFITMMCLRTFLVDKKLLEDKRKTLAQSFDLNWDTEEFKYICSHMLSVSR